MTTGKVKTLFTDKEKTEALFPRTKLSAVSDENGVGLDALMEHLAYTDEKSNDIIINTIDADSLNGVPAKDWAQKSFVTSEIAKAQFSGSGSGDINLDGFATKDDLNNIDFPVDSVNGKTGDVQLSAADVGALSINGGTINGSVDMNGTVTIKGNLVYSDGDINMNSRKVWNLPTPTGQGDAVNKKYVDDGLNTKAPAGYGLGTASNSTYIDDADKATLTGWYKIDSNTVNGIGANAILRVEAYASTYTMQTAIRANGGVIKTRYCNNGAWGEWQSVVDTIGAAPSEHNHDASDITSGTFTAERLPVIPLDKGGTGATTAKGAQAALLSDMNETDAALTDTSTLIFKYSNPGASTGAVFGKKAPLVADYVKKKIQESMTPGMVTICNSNGVLTTSSTVSTGELGYLNGVTSNIQTQLNNKAPLISCGSYSGNLDTTGDGGVPHNSMVWVGTSNSPDGNYGWVETFSNASSKDGGGCIQRYTSVSGAVYIRCKYNNGSSTGWHYPWTRIDTTGFGLGTSLYTDNCNNTNKSGFYRWDNAANNRPFDWGTMLVLNRGGGSVQLAIGHDGETRDEVAVRSISNGVSSWKYLASKEYADTKTPYYRLVVSGAVSCQNVADAITNGTIPGWSSFVAYVDSVDTAPSQGVAIGTINGSGPNAAFIFMHYANNTLYKCQLDGTVLTIKEW